MASVIHYDNVGMGTQARCDVDGAQAYGEALLINGGTLLFCAHCLTANWEKLLVIAESIADHRPYLRNLEANKAASI